MSFSCLVSLEGLNAESYHRGSWILILSYGQLSCFASEWKLFSMIKLTIIVQRYGLLQWSVNTVIDFFSVYIQHKVLWFEWLFQISLLRWYLQSDAQANWSIFQVWNHNAGQGHVWIYFIESIICTENQVNQVVFARDCVGPGVILYTWDGIWSHEARRNTIMRSHIKMNYSLISG